MKRYLYLVLVFVFVVMSVSGTELLDDYCSDSVVAVRFNTKYLREASGLKYKGDDYLQKAAENITNTLRDGFGLDLDKDIEHMGVFCVPSADNTNHYDIRASYRIGYITGNFSPDKQKSIIEHIQKVAETYKVEKAQISGKSVNVLTTPGTVIRIVFLNKNMVIFSRDNVINDIISGKYSFMQAPEAFSNNMNLSDSVAFINKKYLNGILVTVPDITEAVVNLTDDCGNVYVTSKDSELKFGLTYKNSDRSEIVKANLINMNKNENGDDSPEKYKVSQKANHVLFATMDDDMRALFANFTAGAFSSCCPNFEYGTSGRVCFNNHIFLIDAVERYNKNHEKKMNNLDIAKLIEEQYLDAGFLQKDVQPGCSYYSVGDLSTDGTIKCKKHGSMEDISTSIKK